MLTAGVPIWQNHKLVGTATVDVSQPQLSNMLTDLSHYFHGYTMVLDQHNQILSISNNALINDHNVTFPSPLEQLGYIELNKSVSRADKQFIQENLTGQYQQQEVQQQLKQAIIHHSLSSPNASVKILATFRVKQDPQFGTEALVSVLQMPRTYWKVVIVSPLTALNNEATLITSKVGGYLIFAQLLTLIILFIVQHKLLIKPVNDMIEALDKNQLAPLEIMAKQRQDELGILSKTIISRSQQLQVAIDSLDANNLALTEQIEIHKQTQNQLKIHQEQLNAIMNSSPNYIYIKDIEGRYLIINNKYTQLLNREYQEIIGRKDCELFSLKNAKKYAETDELALKSTEAISFEETVPTMHGDIKLTVTKFAILDNNNQVDGIGAIAYPTPQSNLTDET
ncbi:PAS domain-containing protein [Shewanella marina]|uniref:PAS domain-containing protein n=1 Tax=Shewanella marina TaxID=487319 RepID=UPI00068634C8|nr:PAS domain-containing protein [Shewanella marina]